MFCLLPKVDYSPTSIEQALFDDYLIAKPFNWDRFLLLLAIFAPPKQLFSWLNMESVLRGAAEHQSDEDLTRVVLTS